MKRACAALALAMACVSAPTVASPVDEGIIRGPANARHRLTIVSAYSCPYCRVLDMQGSDELARVWEPKGLQVELLPVPIGPTDNAATIAADCGDPAGFQRRTTLLFRAQSSLASNWAGNKTGDPTDVRTVAKASGLYDLTPSLGITRTQLDACLRDPARTAALARWRRIAHEKWHIVGTPTVFLDGRRLESTWASVRTELVNTFRK